MPQSSRSLLLSATALLFVTTNAVMAQTLVREAQADSAPGVPKGMMPPSGKCRVWMDGVPATRQPAPTDCATALRQKPSNARVIYGPNTADQRQAGLDAVRGEKRSLLTPIGLRRPALARPDTPSTRGGVATPTNRGQPAARQTTPPPRTPDAPPKAPPPKAPPPKKPERP